MHRSFPPLPTDFPTKEENQIDPKNQDATDLKKKRRNIYIHTLPISTAT
jgi:hypothetical protein